MRPHEVARRIMVATMGSERVRAEQVFWVETDLFRVEMKNGERFDVRVVKVEK